MEAVGAVSTESFYSGAKAMAGLLDKLFPERHAIDVLQRALVRRIVSQRFDILPIRDPRNPCPELLEPDELDAARVITDRTRVHDPLEN
jgi:hypothetical protein